MPLIDYSGMIPGLYSRLTDILADLKNHDDIGARMMALQELSNILLVSTDRMFTSTFSCEPFVKELVAIARDPIFGYDDPESMLIACRCLSSLMEAIPASVEKIVYGGAVPVLCEKLLNIEYIDVAEQALSTLKKISASFPSYIVRSGGIEACLSHLDFFSTSVQRIAVTIVANCCKGIPLDSFATARDAMPVLLGVLLGSDSQVVEQACLAVTRAIERFKFSRERLEELATDDLLGRVVGLVVPGSTGVVGPHIQTEFLNTLAVVARASPALAAKLVRMDIAATLYHVLTGVSPPSADDLAAGPANSVLVMQTVIHTPRDQVYAVLNVLCELLPGVPRDELLDRDAFADIADGLAFVSADDNRARADSLAGCEARVRALAVVMLPVLLDVYSSIVELSTRMKVIAIFLKMFFNLDGQILLDALQNVQLSSLLASMISQSEHPIIAGSSFQMVSVLLRRLPDVYHYHFEREGVIAEIGKVAEGAREDGEDGEEAEEGEGAGEEEGADEGADEDEEADEDNSDGDDDDDDGDDDGDYADAADSADAAAAAAPTNAAPSPSPSPSPRFKARSLREHIRERLLGAHYNSPRLMDKWVRSNARALLQQYKDSHPESTAASSALSELAVLAGRLRAGGADVAATFAALATHFSASATASISSFELVHSGVLEALLHVLVDHGSAAELLAARTAFLRAFMAGPAGAAPFGVLLAKLHESLVRAETFEVATTGGALDSHASAASSLSRQLCLTLEATDDTRVPKSYRSLTISIPAISTFKTLAEYLSVRIGNEERPAAGPSAASTPGPRSRSSSTSSPRSSFSRRRNSTSVLLESFASFAAAAAAASGAATPKDRAGDSAIAEEDDSAPSTPNPARSDLVDAVSDYAAGREPDERQVSLQLDGDAVVAQTPGGTKVGTPRSEPRPRPSYAAALQAPNPDWHVQFSVAGTVVSYETTIYSAVQAHAAAASYRDVCDTVHTVRYCRAAGPGPAPPANDFLHGAVEGTGAAAAAEGPAAAADDTAGRVLRLLHILHALNASARELAGPAAAPVAVSQFVSSKLTSKLNRQLEEPLIVACGAVPRWTVDLTRRYPFLFPFESRYAYLQSTAFGKFRFMSRLASQRTPAERERRPLPYIGRVSRQKVRISRAQILQSAVKVMDLYGAAASILEVEYFDEVGTGLGPTLEFYTAVSREFSKKRLRMWRDAESDPASEYAFGRGGLFPRPMSAAEAASDAGAKVLQLFRVLGQFVARALVDTRLLDISFSPAFFRADEAVQPSAAAIRAVDAGLAQSFALLERFAAERRRLAAAGAGAAALAAATVDGVAIADLALDFVLPGHPDYELVPGGADTPVTLDNVDAYIAAVVDATLGAGVERQLAAFRDGFSTVFSFAAMQAFTPAELVMICSHGDEDWSLDTLADSIKADHGYTLASQTVQDLLAVMADFSPAERGAFLQFITGSPNLPIGGFKALTPTFTVVCKPHEPPLVADDYLPSVMTCVNYLKLPDYSSRDVLRARLRTAVDEGSGAFLLS
ncbi:uncharacterized protein V1510DRAFT_373433 [Dipodascopsis tothii]|uniref:uncharacterized protein n=1 Tax=Dipodascopsis tothii TaxID=44089 RepID=UPI0034CF2803